MAVNKSGYGVRRNNLPVKWTAAFLAAAVILAYTGIPSAFSYLSASTDPVINTFAAGAISLRLDETELDSNGNETGSRTMRNSYKVMPGMTLKKDPTVTVLAGSEACYVFLYLDNQLPETYFALNLSDYSDYWLEVTSAGDQTIYVYYTTIDASESSEEISLYPLFTQITVSENLTSDDIADMDTRTIIVDAFAVQAYGVSQDTAVSLALAYFTELYEDVWGTVNSDFIVENAGSDGDAEDDEKGEEDEEDEEEAEDDGEETDDEDGEEDIAEDSEEAEEDEAGTDDEDGEEDTGGDDEDEEDDSLADEVGSDDMETEVSGEGEAAEEAEGDEDDAEYTVTESSAEDGASEDTAETAGNNAGAAEMAEETAGSAGDDGTAAADDAETGNADGGEAEPEETDTSDADTAAQDTEESGMSGTDTVDISAETLDTADTSDTDTES